MRALLFSLLFGYSTISSASSVIDRPIDEIVKSSLAFARVNVGSMTASCETGRRCGVYRYVVSVDSLLTGQLTVEDQATLQFCSLLPLRIGASYALALTSSSADVKDEFGCRYTVLEDSAFEKRGRHHYRVTSMSTSIIVDFEGDKYWTNAVRVSDFEAAMKQLGIEDS